MIQHFFFLLRAFLLTAVFLATTGIFAKTNFLGKVKEVDPNLNLVIVEGDPIESVHQHQVYEVVLGDEVYAKVKVTFVGDSYFEARVIEGSVRELYEILSGRAEVIVSGYADFLVLEPEEPQSAVAILKNAQIRKITILDQLPQGFVGKDDTGAKVTLAYGDIKHLYYIDEDEYFKFVKNNQLTAGVLPGAKERERARLEALKIKQRFEVLLRQANVYLLQKKFGLALKNIEQAIQLFPSDYRPYFFKGRALHGIKKYQLSNVMLEKALQLEKKPKELGEIYLTMALNYQALGKLAQAKEFLEKAVDNGKDDLKTATLLAEVELAAGRFNQAITTANWALKHGKAGSPLEKAKLHTMVGRLYLEKQYDLDKSLHHVQLALKLNPHDVEAKKIKNKILLEKSKQAAKENPIDLSMLGGGWRTPDNKLYITFFEEKIMLVFFRESPLKKNIDVILIGGYMNPVQDEDLVLVDEPKTQKFPIGAVKQLKFSQIRQLKENFFSGEEETLDIERQIAFKVIDISPIRLTVILDGKKYKLVPMDTDE